VHKVKQRKSTRRDFVYDLNAFNRFNAHSKQQQGVKIDEWSVFYYYTANY